MNISSEKIIENISLAKKGEQKAFSFLLDTFWGDIYFFLLKRTNNENEAEDITIMTFSKAFDKISTYKEEYQFKTWLITISKNILTDQLRKKRPKLIHQFNKQEKTFSELPDSTPTIEDIIITEQNLTSLLQHLKKLKPHYQKVINLRYFQEMSYEEIADELDESLNNVKVKLLRAKKLLAEIIKTKI